MRKLSVLMVLAVSLFWANTAFAQYSALEDFAGTGPSIGLGGILITGSDSTDASTSEFLPTVSLTGMTEYIVWQAFYGFGSDSSLFGGSVDWILASNFDECMVCPEDQLWWVGVGPTLVSYSDLFTVGTESLSETEVGLNVGGGIRWDQWGLDAYLHYFPSNELFAIQGALLYNFK